MLDAGCGTGRVTKMLLERLPEGHVVAVDSAPSMVAQAREALDPARTTVFQADLAEVVLDEPVDAAFSNAVFHWVPDHEALFARMFEALRPGGRLVAQCGGEGNVERFHRHAQAVGERDPYAPYLAGWTGPWNFASPEQTAERLEAAGFVDVATGLEPWPVTPDEPLEFVRTVCLGTPPRAPARGAARAVRRGGGGGVRQPAGARLRAPEHQRSAAGGLVRRQSGVSPRDSSRQGSRTPTPGRTHLDAPSDTGPVRCDRRHARSPHPPLPRGHPRSSATVHPGVQTVTPKVGQCTSNFIYTSGSDVYIGQAAHCSGTGAATETDGCDSGSLPLGTQVNVTGASRPGTMAYNSWLAMQAPARTTPNACAYNDLALVKLDPADVGKVNPSVPGFGGPSGVGGANAGSDVFSYGNSSLRLGLTQPSPKQGKVVERGRRRLEPDGLHGDPGHPRRLG